jgi:RHS repeat-associated protein
MKSRKLSRYVGVSAVASAQPKLNQPLNLGLSASTNRRKPKLLLLLVLLAALAGSVKLLAQAAPDVEQGMKPYGSYHGGTLDQVGLTNGNLIFHADLLSYSQRGGELAYPFVLQYNNKNFSYYQKPCPAGTKLGTSSCPLRLYVVFGPNPLRTSQASEGSSVTIGFEGFPGVGAGFIDSTYAFEGNEIYAGPASVVMPDRSVRQLATTGTGGLVTLDGSGFSASFTGSAYAPASSGPSDSNGTVSSVVGNAAEDRNGNQIGTNNSGGWTDTLGRQIPPPAPGPVTPAATPPASTASSGACPALPYAFQPVSNTYIWNLPTVNGGTLPLVLCYAGVYVRTGKPNTPPIIQVNRNFTMLQSVVFPDNTYWAFQYDAADPNNTSSYAFGDLLKVTSPTGGSITYTWGLSNAMCSSGFDRAVQTRTVDANDGTGPHTWSYTFSGINASSSNTIVTDPLGNDTVHLITGMGAATIGGLSCSLYETQTLYYQGSLTSGTLLKTVNTDYQYTINPYDPAVIGSGGVESDATTVTNVFPIRVTTTLPNGLVSKVETDYDSALAYHGPFDGITWNEQTCTPTESGTGGNSVICTYTNPTTNPVTNYTGSYGKVIATRAYDWGQGAPGAILRQTQTQYQWQVNSAYLAANMMDLPAVVQTLDGSGNLCAETDYFYDEPGYLTTPSPAISTQHGATPAAVRGNLTTVTHKLSATPCSPNATWSSVSSHTNWFDTGEVYQSIDPLGHTTTHAYDPAYAGAYPTKTTNALGQSVSGVYDFNTGLLTSFTDANTQASTYSYDNRWRMTSAVFPADSSGNHPETDFSYPNATTVQRSKKQDPSHWIVNYAYFDGVGRTTQTRLVDPAGDDYVDTTYDAAGRVSTVSNPHRSTAGTTDGITTNIYDALGRVIQTTAQDGSVTTTDYSNFPTVTVTDPAGKKRSSLTDALGRLITVWEDPSGLNYETDYAYDPLGNLIKVTQNGSNPANARIRTFTYDSFSRLLTANNPESGAISYVYDADGNLVSKTSPAANQSSGATQAVSYCYDNLNRMVGKGYGQQSCPLSSPAVTYTYDQGANGIGHLSSLSDPAGSGSYIYDPLGRMASEQRTINGVSKSMSYQYFLDGSINTLKYPSGAVITYNADTAGRAVSAVDQAKNINYVSGSGGPNSAAGAAYAPDGSILSYNNGWSTSFDGIANSFSYNSRLQPVNMAAVSPGSTGTSATASVTISGALSGLGAADVPAAGSPLASHLDAAGTGHLFFIDGNNHVIHVAVQAGGPSQTQDITALSGGPAAMAGSQLASYDNLGGAVVIFEGTNQHIYGLYYNGANWTSSDYTAMASTTVVAAPGTPLTAFLNAPSDSYFYLGTNNHIYELLWNGSSMSNLDLTGLSGGPPAISGSKLSSYNNAGNPVVIYQGANQHIYGIYFNGSNWTDSDYTAMASTTIAGASGTALTSFLNAPSESNFYLGADNHVYELLWNGSSTSNLDLTALSGGPPAISGSKLSSYNNAGKPVAIYQGANQHIYGIYFNGSNWTDSDYTAMASTTIVGMSGTALTSFLNAPNELFFYQAANNHVYDAYWNGSSMFNLDMTPNGDSDAGTVTLKLGGFIATACFGPSTNTACNGQAVNSTSAQIAAALAQAINVAGSPATASVASGSSIINLTWKAVGPFTTAVEELSTAHDNPDLFPNPSFTSTATNFNGGSGANVPVLNLSYDFHVGNGNNGNVWGITNNKDSSRSQSFTYDPLNRLASAQNAGSDCRKTTVNDKTEYWGNSYGYDSWGNLLQKTVTKCSAENLSVMVLTNNQILGYGYDAAGNMTYDATSGLHYSFDQENRITGAGGYTYVYDGDGNRVEKTIEGSTPSGTLYWYMSPGIVAESDLSGNLQSEYIFFDGERVARKDLPGNAVSYYFSDYLKTTDIVTDAQGSIKNESDFYPWGGELQFVNGDSNHYKFTGKERDAETGLDYFGARYYSNGLGRFVTPDWAARPIAVPYADFGNPQSLNLYRYGQNNPMTFGDPDGHCCWDQIKGIAIGIFNQTPGGMATNGMRRAYKEFKHPGATLADAKAALKSFIIGQLAVGGTILPGDPTAQKMVAAQFNSMSTTDKWASGTGTVLQTLGFFAGLGISGPAAPEAPQFVFRGDPALMDVAFNEGIQPKGASTDLLAHALNSDNPASGFVATSRSPAEAAVFADQIYVIRSVNGIDVNETLGQFSPFSREQEIAIRGPVSPSDVRAVTLPNQGVSILNPNYKP